jgi:hypothetical protein
MEIVIQKSSELSNIYYNVVDNSIKNYYVFELHNSALVRISLILIKFVVSPNDS